MKRREHGCLSPDIIVGRSFHAEQRSKLILANFSAAAIFLWFVSFNRLKEMNWGFKGVNPFITTGIISLTVKKVFNLETPDVVSLLPDHQTIGNQVMQCLLLFGKSCEDVADHEDHTGDDFTEIAARSPSKRYPVSIHISNL